MYAEQQEIGGNIAHSRSLIATSQATRLALARRCFGLLASLVSKNYLSY
jgi:hypothetical protein